MNGPVTNSLGVPAYRDVPPLVCRDVGAHCANTSIGAVDHIVGADSCAAMTTLTPAGNQAFMYAVPFASPPFACGIDRLAFEVTTAQAGTQAFIGLFEDVNFNYFPIQGDALKPGRMLHDSGAIATTAPAALKTSAVSNVRLKPNRWYWLVYRVAVETTHATVRAVQANVASRMLGVVAISSSTGASLVASAATVQHENWGNSPEITASNWSLHTLAFPVMRYRLTT